MSNHDPGWNDPPTFSYTANIGPKRTLLNKRVSFPVSSPSVTNSRDSSLFMSPVPLSSLSSPVILSPIPSVPALSKTHNVVNEQDAAQDDGCLLTPTKSEEEMLSGILSVFSATISKIPQDSEFSEEKKIEDIKSRLKTFEEMWPATLSPVVKRKMSKLAEDLLARKYDEADSLHCSLIVDHISEVSQWMVAVKHIIQIAKALSACENRNILTALSQG